MWGRNKVHVPLYPSSGTELLKPHLVSDYHLWNSGPFKLFVDNHSEYNSSLDSYNIILRVEIRFEMSHLAEVSWSYRRPSR